MSSLFMVLGWVLLGIYCWDKPGGTILFVSVFSLIVGSGMETCKAWWRKS